MLKLIGLGILSGLFFSATFVLNEAMSAAGGHWLWSASLRYGFVIIFLTLFLSMRKGVSYLKELTRLLLEYKSFWVITGTIGFGFFYLFLCYSADHTPGWIISATWQFTLVASLIIFGLLGKSFHPLVWVFAIVIVAGVVLVNLSHLHTMTSDQLIYGAVPVLIAAFCYPLGNQILWEAKYGTHKHIPHIKSPLLNDVFAKIWLLSVGTIPLWLVLVAVVQPEAPSGGQLTSTAIVALCSGVIATGLFIMARNKASNTTEIAAVDATQASDVLFAIIGGYLLLGSELPNLVSTIGIIVIVIGLGLFLKYQKLEPKPRIHTDKVV